jgi:small-conductance mechanosensitive channel
MPQPDIISDYLDTLSRELSFDTLLARRVRQEVEDHLSEAVAAEPEDDSGAAQRRAIRNFGDPRAIASEYAAQSLFRQTRRVGILAVVVAAGILVVMNARGVWYGWMQWGLSAELAAARRIGLSIDLYAYAIALAIGLVGWAYIGTRRLAASFDAPYRDQMKRCLLLCAVAAAPLIAAVVTDTALTGLRLFESELRSSALVPIVTMAGEIAFAGLLVAQLRKALRRAALASSLFCG